MMEIYSTPRKRKTINPILVIGIIVVIGIVSFLIVRNKPVEVVENIVEEDISPKTSYEVIGKSVEGRDIESFTFGDGNTNLLFVGGIHGGYEWNSVILAYEFIDYLTNNPEVVPEDLKISIIPVLNPDGLFDVVGLEGRFSVTDVPLAIESVGLGRFNANSVDLNRNFACKWKPESSWRGNVVDAGTAAFSEPEALSLKNYVEKTDPSAAIFWHSQANTVYASECESGVIPETLDIMNLYSKAAGYNSVASFDAYEVTGDAEGWLASIGIPAITVELKTHETVEFQQNLAGFKALLDYYTN